MIFVTVGSQLPFDRLVGAVAAWSVRGPNRPEVFAQVGMGRTDHPRLRCVRFLEGAQYREAVGTARLIVAHAGIGSILAALEEGVPAIIVPRDHRRGECLNDHQEQTARQLERMGIVTVAWSESDLPDVLDVELAKPESHRPPRRPATDLVEHLRTYLRGVLGKSGQG